MKLWRTEMVLVKARRIGQNLLKDVFGSLNEWEVDSQKVKDDLRKEWSRW